MNKKERYKLKEENINYNIQCEEITDTLTINTTIKGWMTYGEIVDTLNNYYEIIQNLKQENNYLKEKENTNEKTITNNKERFQLTHNQRNEYEIIDHEESQQETIKRGHKTLCIYNDLGNTYSSSAPQLCELLNKLNNENKTLTLEIEDLNHYTKYLNTRIEQLKVKRDKERNSTTKQHLKWDKEAQTKINKLQQENNNLKKALYEAEKSYIEETNDNSLDIEMDMEYLKKEFEREYWND